EHQGLAQERAGKMLRRRCVPQEEAARKTKGRQETHEADRHRRGAAGSVSGHPPSGRLMGALTGVLYGGLLVYLGGWFMGYWTGDFSLLLFLLTVVTLVYWLAERFHFQPARVAAAQRLEAQDAERRAALNQRGITQVDGDI